MAVANVIRVSLVGAMPAGEVWSVNPVWQIGGVSTAEDISTDEALAMATAVDGIVISTGITQMMSTSTTITGCRVEARRWDGTLAAQAEHVRAVAVPGTGSTGHPYQTSLVTSLRTGAVGGSGRGRLYWPLTGMNLNVPTLRPLSTNVASSLLGVRTWLVAVTAALDVTLTNSPVLSVWSRKNASTAPVTSVQMGDIADTQRRRRDSLLETYSSLTYPT